MADFDGFLVSLPAPSFSDAFSSDAPIVDGSLVPQLAFSSSDAAFFLPEIVVPPGGHTLDANTIALWRLNDAQDAGDDIDTIREISGNGLDMVITGGVQIVPGPALLPVKWFASDYATLPNSALLTDLFRTEWSYEGWIAPGDTSADYVFSYSASGESLATNFLASISVSSTSVTVFCERASGTNISATSTLTVIPLNVWSHLAITKTDVGGGNVDYNFYLDGVFKETITVANCEGVAGGGSQTFILGASTGGGTPMRGGMGSMRWSSGVRSLGEIQASFGRPDGDHEVDGTTVINIPMDEPPALFDEVRNSHLSLFAGLQESTSPIVAGEGLSRNFDTLSNYGAPANDEYPPSAALILAAVKDEMTVEFWGILGTNWKDRSKCGAWVFGNPGVETAADNFLAFEILSDRRIQIFSEHGAGINDIWQTTLPVLTVENQYDLHHYAMTLVASGGFTTYEVYIDGALVETSDGTDITLEDGTDNRWNLGQGSASGSNDGWLGRIDDMRISNKKRTGIEIRDSYLAGIGTIVEAGPTGPTYRMRGFDVGLGRYAYWNSSEVDDDASDYTGPGAVVDIVVQAILGAE